MRRKQKWICLIILLILTSFCATLARTMVERPKHVQQFSESNLPFSEHATKIEQAVIRVVIKTDGFKNITHPMIQISGNGGIRLEYGAENEEFHTDEIIQIFPDDARFQKGKIRINEMGKGRLTLHSIKRGYGTSSYEGTIELFSTSEGIVIVNEIPLENYLYAVVPSEMPASYELEALKCQAVCARSYAYCHMQTMAYPEYQAHVDDSTSYQVYGNSKVQERTMKAVDETRGEMLTYKDNIIKTYYFSTSCGKTTSIEAWGTELKENNRYLCGVNVCDDKSNDYEKELPWYRWKAVISEQRMTELLEMNAGKEIGKLQSVQITKTGAGGAAIQLTAIGTKGKVVVETENKIRKVLGGEGYKLEKQDGTVTNSKQLLPSAFFTIQKEGTTYVIQGGGHGHGIGMSQNGANEMAKKGKNYEEILEFFYPGTKVK